MYAFLIHWKSNDPRLNLLRQLLTRLDYAVVETETPTTLLRLAELTRNLNSLIILPALTSEQLTAEAIRATVEKVKGHGFVVYVADEIQSDDYKSLVRTGNADWASWNSALAEIVDISRRQRALAMEPSKVGPTELGQDHVVITFMGTNGGVGNTTLAMETALSLAKGKNPRRVALIDLDFQRSVVCDYLDLSPRLDIGELIRNPQRLDDFMLDIFASKHSASVDVFAADKSELDYASMDETVIFALLNRLSERYQTVIIDAPALQTRWLDRVLTNSDFVFATCRYTVPSVKQLYRTLNHLKALEIPFDRMAAVINECESKLFGGLVRRSDIDTLISGQAKTFYVQSDAAFARESVNCGRSMVLSNPSKGISKDIRKIADELRKLGPKTS